MAETLTITLTGRPPVRIHKPDWPIVAEVFEHDGAVRHEANRTWRLVVRQHADGRTIVYGVFDTVMPGERERRGGELLEPGADVVAAIQRVAQHLGFDPILAERCIADLRAEELV